MIIEKNNYSFYWPCIKNAFLLWTDGSGPRPAPSPTSKRPSRSAASATPPLQPSILRRWNTRCWRAASPKTVLTSSCATSATVAAVLHRSRALNCRRFTRLSLGTARMLSLHRKRTLISATSTSTRRTSSKLPVLFSPSMQNTDWLTHYHLAFRSSLVCLFSFVYATMAKGAHEVAVEGKESLCMNCVHFRSSFSMLWEILDISDFKRDPFSDLWCSI